MKTLILIVALILLIDLKYGRKWGLLSRKGSFWIGCHYSPYNKRYCINLLPCITLWVIEEGGKTP